MTATARIFKGRPVRVISPLDDQTGFSDGAATAAPEPPASTGHETEMQFLLSIGADRPGSGGRIDLRPALAAGALALALAGCSFDPMPGAGDEITAASTNEAAAAASLISAYRVAHGLPAVTVDGTLNDAALHQARAVAQAGKLSHGNFVSRMGAFGIRGAAAENLTAGPASVSEAVQRWKVSPGHNENLLMPEARRIGLARVDASGRYGRYWALVLGQ